MSGSFKICPICATPNPQNAPLCRMCGTSLAGIEPVTRIVRSKTLSLADFDFRYGETDLLEAPLSRRGKNAFTIVIVALVAFVLGGAAFAAGSAFLALQTAHSPVSGMSSTPSPAVSYSTVTFGPPTATATFTPAPTQTPSVTFTPEPCIQQIVQGDSVLGAMARCGHRDQNVLPTVLALNGITNPNNIQIGQQIVIPWPTPTPDPNAVPTATPVAAVTSDTSIAGLDLMTLNEAIDPFAPTATPTLPPGVIWHEVQPNENMIILVDLYHASTKVLSELNPEIDFALCDFGQIYGGPECRVALSIGQKVRVPAPTPLPTSSPTPDPNATATPTTTPTYNEPHAISPADRQFFGRDELVTLRWVPSATLAANELYRIDVEDTTIGVKYTAFTREIAFIVPLDWRGREKERHEFVWTVGVVNDATRDVVRFQTAPRIFVWQGFIEGQK